MRSILTSVAALAVFAALAPASHAGIFDKTPTDGEATYVSGFIGGAFPSNSNFEGVQNPAAGVPGTAGANANVSADLDSDVYYGAAIGKRLPFKFLNVFQPRLELEYSRYEADVSSGNFNGGNQTFGGDQSQTFILLNSYNDIRWKADQRIVPYFGGGIGFGIVDSNINYFPNNGVATAPTFAAQGKDTGFATVSAAGMTLNATDKFDVYVEGRYFKTYGIDSERRFIANENSGFSANLDDDPDGLTVSVGTRFKF